VSGDQPERVIVMWNIIITLIFYYIILPTWRSGLRVRGKPSGNPNSEACQTTPPAA
jgi:hypothetical protein